jgi:hypothetical protein
VIRLTRSLRARFALAAIFLPLVAFSLAAPTAAQNAPGRFLYVLDHNETENRIWGFSAAPNGAIAPLSWESRGTGGVGGSAIYSGGTYLVADTQGRFLFASNNQSATIGAFRVDLASGALTPVPGSPFAASVAPGVGIPLAVTSDDDFLIAGGTTTGAIAVFAIGDDGRLTKAPGSPYTYGAPGVASDMALSPDGRFVAIALLDASAVALLSLDPSGRLAPAPGSLFFLDELTLPLGLEFGSNGDKLYVTASPLDPALEIEILDVAADGRITESPASPFTLPQSVVAESTRRSPDGTLLFVSDSGAPGVTVLRIAENGGLSLQSSVDFPPDTPWANDLVTDRDGKLLVAPGVAGGVSVYSIGGSGGLAPVAGSPFFLKPRGVLLSSVVVPPPSPRAEIGCASNVRIGASLVDEGQIGAIVDYAQPTIENCPSAVVTCTPESGGFFPAGVTEVTCTAEDACGEPLSCGFRVTVTLPTAVCATDGATNDSFVVVVDQTSPLYGAWSYRVAATGQSFAGRATIAKNTATKFAVKQKGAGIKLKVKGKPTTGALTVTLTIDGRTYRLSGTSAFDGSACP